MLELNLVKKDEAQKTPMTTLIYESDLLRIREIAAITGISQQNLCRHALNNLLDEMKDIEC